MVLDFCCILFARGEKEGKKTEGKYQGKVISIHFEHDAIYIFLKFFLLHHNHFNARALIGQSAMGYCAGKPMEKSRVFRIIILKQ